jgi:ACT domain-containing protein
VGRGQFGLDIIKTLEWAKQTIFLRVPFFSKFLQYLNPFPHLQLDDEPGLLSMVLKTIAEFHANILTIHQSVPVNGIASLSLSIDVFPATGNVEDMRNSIESVQGIHYAKILARE